MKSKKVQIILLVVLVFIVIGMAYLLLFGDDTSSPVVQPVPKLKSASAPKISSQADIEQSGNDAEKTTTTNTINNAGQKVVTILAPKKLSLKSYIEKESEHRQASLSLNDDAFNQKLIALRDAQIDAETAIAKAKTREAQRKGLGSDAAQPISTAIPPLPAGTASAQINSAHKITNHRLTSSAFNSAYLSYFDPRTRNAYLTINGKAYRARRGLTVGNLTVSEVTRKGVLIKSGNNKRLVTSEQTFSFPDFDPSATKSTANSVSEKNKAHYK